jgi:hypothetical protein
VKRLSDQTLYEIIEVSVDAPPEEIERACDRAAATYGAGALATYMLAAPEETALLSRRIEEARAVLLDPSARSRYDERIGVRPVALAAPDPAPDPAPEAMIDPAPDPRPAPPPWPPPELEPVPAEARHISPGLPAVSTPAAVETVPLAATAESLPAGPLPKPPAPVAEPPPPVAEPAFTTARPALPHPPPPIQLTVPVIEPVAATPLPPILLEKVVAEPPSAPVPEGSAWTGEMLRQVREARGLSVQQLAEKTRVTRHHLENIEQDRFTALPAPVYLRGIIMSLARELRLDGQKVARSYLDRMGPAHQGEPRR